VRGPVPWKAENPLSLQPTIQTSKVNTTRSKYQVHAEVLATGIVSAELDDEKAGHPLARRLNRIERVAATYLGRVERRLNNGLQMAFETADAALLGACEMQHRCAVLPQVSGNRLVLRIGIHYGEIRQRLKDGGDNLRELASQLAVLDDGIVASGIVVDALNPELRKLTSPLSDLPAEIVAHKVDWRCEIPSAAYGSESVWPTTKDPHPIGPHLVLHYDRKTLELTQNNPAVTVGREILNDLVVVGTNISRHHCRIERRVDCIVLTDSSTNGTCVAPEEGAELFLKKDSVVLRGRGMLFFGRPCNGERRGGVKYEAYG
jgi:hypothetical protein